jgi:hypothetical protein
MEIYVEIILLIHPEKPIHCTEMPSQNLSDDCHEIMSFWSDCFFSHINVLAIRAPSSRGSKALMVGIFIISTYIVPFVTSFVRRNQNLSQDKGYDKDYDQ